MSDSGSETRDQVLRVVVAGGGTGARTFAALAVATRLHRHTTPRAQVLWAGESGSLEQRTAHDAAIAFTPITPGTPGAARHRPGMSTRAALGAAVRVPFAVAGAWRVLRAFDPDVVLATGGPAAVPLAMAARLRGIALVAHVHAPADHRIARWATHITLPDATALAALPPRWRARVRVTGHPLRAGITTGDPGRARTLLGEGFDPRLPTVYITGGTRGAPHINDAVTGCLDWLLLHANVIHQTGPAHLTAQQACAETLPAELAVRYRVTGAVPTAMVGDVLALADVVVSHGGAATVAELAAIGTPMLLLPPSGGGGEHATARRLADVGAAEVVLAPITPETVRAALAALLADPARRAGLATRARELGTPAATEARCELLVAVADTPHRSRPWSHSRGAARTGR